MFKWLLLAVALIWLWSKRGDFVATIGRFAAKGDPDQLYLWLKRACRFGGVSFINRYQYAFFTLKRGQVEEAAKLFNLLSMSTAKPMQKRQIRGSQALIHWKRKEYDDAIEMLEEILAVGKNTVTYGSLGLIYLEAGQTEKALAFCEEAYEYNADDMVIMDNYAAALAANGKTAEAEEMYRKLLEKKPHFPEPYYGLGRLLAAREEKAEAKELLETALTKRFQFTSTITVEEVKQALDQLS